MENTVKSTKNIISQLKGESSKDLLMGQLPRPGQTAQEYKGFAKGRGIKEGELQQCIE